MDCHWAFHIPLMGVVTPWLMWVSTPFTEEGSKKTNHWADLSELVLLSPERQPSVEDTESSQ